MSLLLALTARKKSENHEKLLFLHAKVVPHFDEETTLVTLCPHKRLCVVQEQEVYLTDIVGQTTDVNRYFGECLRHKVIEYDKSNAKIQVDLNVPEDTQLQPEEAGDYGQKGYVSHIGKIEKRSWFPEFFLNEDFLDALSGYSIIKGVSPISPAGLYDKKWLHGKIATGIYAIREERSIYVDFHGVRSSAVDQQGCREFKGFVQSQQRFDGERVQLCDPDTGKSIASAEIDAHSGIFQMKSEKPVKSGKFIYETHEGTSETTFHLIMGFDIKAGVCNKSYTDAYGRTMFLSEKKPRPESFKNKSWFNPAFATPKEAEKALHDIMVEALSLCGPHIILIDPYFMGDIEEEAADVWTPSLATRAFVNSLIKVNTVYGIESVTLLGNSRMKSKTSKSSSAKATAMEELTNRYRRFWEHVWKRLNSQNIKPWKLEIKLAGSDFHNRYWFATDEQGKKLGERGICVSNSISGMEEADFGMIDSGNQLDHVSARYEQIMKNAKTLLSL